MHSSRSRVGGKSLRKGAAGPNGAVNYDLIRISPADVPKRKFKGMKPVPEMATSDSAEAEALCGHDLKSLREGAKPVGRRAVFSLAKRRSAQPSKSSLPMKYNALEALAQVTLEDDRTRRLLATHGPMKHRLDADEEELRTPRDWALEEEYGALESISASGPGVWAIHAGDNDDDEDACYGTMEGDSTGSGQELETLSEVACSDGSAVSPGDETPAGLAEVAACLAASVPDPSVSAGGDTVGGPTVVCTAEGASEAAAAEAARTPEPIDLSQDPADEAWEAATVEAACSPDTSGLLRTPERASEAGATELTRSPDYSEHVYTPGAPSEATTMEATSSPYSGNLPHTPDRASEAGATESTCSPSHGELLYTPGTPSEATSMEATSPADLNSVPRTPDRASEAGATESTRSPDSSELLCTPGAASEATALEATSSPASCNFPHIPASESLATEAARSPESGASRDAPACSSCTERGAAASGEAEAQGSKPRRVSVKPTVKHRDFAEVMSMRRRREEVAMVAAATEATRRQESGEHVHTPEMAMVAAAASRPDAIERVQSPAAAPEAAATEATRCTVSGGLPRDPDPEVATEAAASRRPDASERIQHPEATSEAAATEATSSTGSSGLLYDPEVAAEAPATEATCCPDPGDDVHNPVPEVQIAEKHQAPPVRAWHWLLSMYSGPGSGGCLAGVGSMLAKRSNRQRRRA